MNKIITTSFVFLLSTASMVHAQTYELTSFDNNIKLTVNTKSKITWSVTYKGKSVIEPSEIAMTIDDHVVLGDNPRVSKKTETQKDEMIIPEVAQKASKIRDHYKQLTLSFKGNYAIEFRLYDEGVAYRFLTSLKKDITVQSETFKLSFPARTRSLFPIEETLVSHYERTYIPTMIDTLTTKQFCSLPVLIETNDSTKVLLTEADLFDYPGMFMYGTKSNALTAGFPKYVLEATPQPGAEDRNEILKSADYIAKTSGNRSFPWRVCIITNDDRKLPESNLVYQLSRPSKLENTSWIKPGKVAWDWYNANNIYGVDFKSGLNTQTYKYYIDFASEYGLDYIILDEGWTKTTTNTLESNPDIDVAELIKYGNSKNVGIILWTLWGPLDKNMEQIMKTYSDWGAKGVKIDFMQRADQYMVNYYERVAKEAAKNKLLADFHGAFKPAGLRRAYPNVISYEGVKGNENNKWSADVTPEHTVILPFTRMVAGPMDFTPGAMRNAQRDNFRISFPRPMSLGTRCHQIAMYVVYESPLQMLCDAPSAYYKEKETTEFIAKIPTTWDETKVLKAKVADYIVTARRKGDTWYIGAMTDWTPRKLTLDLSFLGDGSYTMELMRDGVNADRFAEDYKKETKTVNRNTKMEIELAPGGGWAAIISH